MISNILAEVILKLSTHRSNKYINNFQNDRKTYAIDGFYSDVASILHPPSNIAFSSSRNAANIYIYCVSLHYVLSLITKFTLLGSAPHLRL